MIVQLNKPYKIVGTRYKRYESHYHVPAAHCLIVPLRQLGEEVSCDIRWENDNGELQQLTQKIFEIRNLVPLNAMHDAKLFELWQEHYPEKVTL